MIKIGNAVEEILRLCLRDAVQLTAGGDYSDDRAHPVSMDKSSSQAGVDDRVPPHGAAWPRP